MRRCSLFVIVTAHALWSGLDVGAEEKTPPRLTGMSCYPAVVNLVDSRSHVQPLVSGQDADGFVHDLTRDVRYASDDATVASVDAAGVVRPVRGGKTFIRIGGFGQNVRIPIHVADMTRTPPVSFTHEVMPVLGKAGCNSGPCHGHASGKGGFQLSLRGTNPASDLESLTRRHVGRRINLVTPRASLMLQKPAGLIQHGGGQRFAVDSASYQLLRQWLAEGARGDLDTPKRLERIEVFPADRVLPRPGLKQQLTVWAHFSDGEVRDVTEYAIYELTAAHGAEVDSRGLVLAKEVGATPVLVRFQGKMAVSRLIVIHRRPDFAWIDPPVHNFIDEHVFAKLKVMEVLPSDLSSDVEFLRRVSFDAVGLPPTPEEVRSFLADRRSDKRERKIDELLDRAEFADQWALYWLDHLRADESGTAMGRKGVWALSRWLRQAFDTNMPYDRFVRAFLTARGSQFQNPPAAFSRVFREPQEKSEAIAQLFLGTRLECAQCHDHPFDRWTQADYNALRDFFSQVRKKDGPDYYDEAQIYLEPEKAKKVHLRFLDGSEIDWPGEKDRRAALADWMFGPGKRWTARALINRVWGKLLGRGIVDPVDDFRFSNPAVNEPLLDALADDFIAHGYDFKHLVRTILKSRTYQLSARPNASNADERTNFSKASLRRLSAEQLLDALVQISGIEEEFAGAPPGFRAAQIPTSRPGSYFLRAFGRPARKTPCSCERSSVPTLPQVLHLMNGSTTMKRLRAEGGTLDRLLKAKLSEEDLIEELYLSALSRPPGTEERIRARRYLREADDIAQGAEDLFWALLNSRQFLFNH